MRLHNLAARDPHGDVSWRYAASGGWRTLRPAAPPAFGDAVRRLTRTDTLLLWSLLAIFAAAFSLHAVEALRTGLHQPPVFAAPGTGDDPYPRVGGLRLERGIEPQGLEVGDRLLSVGGEDLAGVGYLLFEGIVIEHAAGNETVPLVFERDGVRQEMELRLLRHRISWFRMPFLLCVVAVATLILLRAPDWPGARALFVGCVAMAALEAPFMGGSRWQTVIYSAAFNFGLAFALYFALRGFIELPREVPEEKRAPKQLAWIAGLHVVFRLNYLAGGPLPTDWSPILALFADSVILATIVGIITWNTWHATPVGRRRIKWALFGFYVGGLPMIGTLVFQLPGGPAESFSLFFEWSGLFAVFIPFGFMMGILRFNLFDIDRVWSATLTFTVLGSALLVLLVGLVPELAERVSSVTGLPETSTRVGVALGLGALLLPAQRHIRDWTDRLLFPRRRAQHQHLTGLIAEVGAATTDAELVARLRSGLREVLEPEPCTVWLTSADGVATLGEPPTQELLQAARAALLELREPLQLSRPQPAAGLTLPQREALRRAGYELLLPLRGDGVPDAVVALGPMRSGDVYTMTDVALLRSLLERARSRRQRLRDEERLRAERDRSERMQTLKEASDAAQAARSRFLAAASHDLRQPLHALGMYAEQLQSQLEDDPASETASQLQRSAESLREMFTSLLDLSRLDVGSVEPQQRDFDLPELLEALGADAQPLASAKGLELRIESEPLRVHSDPVLLGRILRNLATNAVRYTDQGSVTIRARRADESVVVEVADTGPGIPLEQQAAIFGEFDRGGRQDGDGLGLGLTVVERLAEALGHDLALDSAPGQGTRFRLTLPRAQPVRDRSVPAGEVGSLAGMRVLVVDDDLAILSSTRAVLESWGCNAHVAASGEEAFAVIDARGTPDALLLDFRLAGGETGLAVLDAVESKCGPIPAALVSAEADSAALRPARDRGLPVLPKPVSPARLRATLLQLQRRTEPSRAASP